MKEGRLLSKQTDPTGVSSTGIGALSGENHESPPKRIFMIGHLGQSCLRKNIFPYHTSRGRQPAVRTLVPSAGSTRICRFGACLQVILFLPLA